MNRKTFIKQNGGECANWSWSWSFVNHSAKSVFFGIWEDCDLAEKGLILSTDWERNKTGRKQAGYGQAIKHLKLIEQNKYKLFTFRLIPGEQKTAKELTGPAKIGSFHENLVEKKLERFGGDWYAVEINSKRFFPEDIGPEEVYFEGAIREVRLNSYERNQYARNACLQHFGYQCQVCAFDFTKIYGILGKDFIHVHHIVPLSEIREEYSIDPIKHLIPVCPNCHSMIHRTKPILTIEKLKKIIETASQDVSCILNSH